MATVNTLKRITMETMSRYYNSFKDSSCQGDKEKVKEYPCGYFYQDDDLYYTQCNYDAVLQNTSSSSSWNSSSSSSSSTTIFVSLIIALMMLIW